MNSQENLRRTINYYNSMRSYLERDLVALNQIKSTDQHGYCAIPHLLSILCFMELLGYVISGKDQSDQRIEQYIKAFTPELKPWEGVINKLIKNGLAHRYFPKNIAISKHADQRDELFYKAYDGKVTLNVNKFSSVVEKSLDKVEQRLKSEPDDVLHEIYSRIAKIEQEDSEAFQNHKQQFDNLFVVGQVTQYPPTTRNPADLLR